MYLWEPAPAGLEAEFRNGPTQMLLREEEAATGSWRGREQLISRMKAISESEGAGSGVFAGPGSNVKSAWRVFRSIPYNVVSERNKSMMVW